MAIIMGNSHNRLLFSPDLFIYIYCHYPKELDSVTQYHSQPVKQYH